MTSLTRVRFSVDVVIVHTVQGQVYCQHWIINAPSVREVRDLGFPGPRGRRSVFDAA